MQPVLLSLIFYGLLISNVQAEDASPKIADWCKKVQSYYKRYGWKEKSCEEIRWHAEESSVQGEPLVYGEFGQRDSKNKTLVLSMIHGDEITPLYVGFSLAQWLAKNELKIKDAYVIVAPLVNPDGLFAKRPTRVNARGVDVNRNFNTKDWHEKAQKIWEKYKKNPRRNPGDTSNSEPETLFQIHLLEKFRPTKILSLHAPLNVMDYDGPSSMTLEDFPNHYVETCEKLKKSLKAKTTGFFPGSLGNYAGFESGIPTITLELSTSDPAMAKSFWEKFTLGIQKMIDYRVELTKETTSETSPVPPSTAPESKAAGS